jgi:hypothetical protein
MIEERGGVRRRSSSSGENAGADPIRLGLSFFASISLFYLYFYFLSAFLPGVSLTNAIEVAIVYTQILRLIAVASIRRLRRGSFQSKIILFSFEVFVIAILIAIYFVTKDVSYNLLIGEILLAWIGAVLVILTPYALIRFAVAMYSGGELYSVLNYAAWEYVSVFFLASLVAESSGPLPSSVAGLGVSVINSVTNELRTGSEVFTYTSPIIVASAVFFVSLALYSAFVNSPAESPPRNYYPIVFPLLATIILLGWMELFQLFTSDVFLVLSIPSLSIAIALWWLSRGRRSTSGASKGLNAEKELT